MMKPYNQTVEIATVGGNNASTRKGRAHITFMNSKRAQMFDQWVTMASNPKDAMKIKLSPLIHDTRGRYQILYCSFLDPLLCMDSLASGLKSGS